MYPPKDPIDTLIHRVRKIALTLMDDGLILNVGMNTPNRIVTAPLYFERLDTEANIRRRVAQYRRTQRLVAGTKLLCASIIAAKRI